MCDSASISKVTYVTPLFENPIPVVSKIAAAYSNEVVTRWPGDNDPGIVESTVAQLSEYFLFTLEDVMHVVYIAVGLTILRFILDTMLFKQIPKWVKMETSSAAKFPESAFSFIVYSFAWSWSFYIVATHPKRLFSNLASHWSGWGRHIQVEPILYWLYMFQLGFYSHFLFTTLFINTKRKDFVVLLLHHFLTLALLGWAYAVRYHYVGLMVLLFHDIGDVMLEFAKILVYFKELGGQKYHFFKLSADIAFGCFAIQWIFCRLYWFPTKVLQSSAYASMLVCPGGAFYLPFNAMLFALYLMQVYWFYLILKLLIRVLVHGEETEDTREYDVAEKKEMEKKKHK